jgi:type III pantothenate kinase
MNLVVDAGNTLIKSAFFSGNEILSSSTLENLSLDALKNLLHTNFPVSNVILSSVVLLDQEIIRFLKTNYHFIELTHGTRIPIENLYQSQLTLGSDRLASAAGANFFFKNQHVLSVDMGTCIKYDFVNEKNQYLGGGISPGIEMRFKALNAYTEKIPLISYRSSADLIGVNTEGSVLSGVINGTLEEVRGIVSRYKEQYAGIKVIFTGGYHKLAGQIFNLPGKEKSNIFADPFLVLKGLNQILNYNLH